ncbi:hypothetical protein BDW42DRAFT_163622 [Aspergillus taichungensis]|uniref:Uncharacterized protein n=1 Tax=Aspergillus taichungensis TaxID=482145 RepID=A0A2J5I2N8_9EURO|nr:hypothetical protein BDW42DRAFT_163622 [Aspergillus taichungensis]
MVYSFEPAFVRHGFGEGGEGYFQLAGTLPAVLSVCVVLWKVGGCISWVMRLSCFRCWALCCDGLYCIWQMVLFME